MSAVCIVSMGRAGQGGVGVVIEAWLSGWGVAVEFAWLVWAGPLLVWAGRCGCGIEVWLSGWGVAVQFALLVWVGHSA